MLRSMGILFLAGACVTIPATAAQPDADVQALCAADQADRDAKNPDWNGRQIDWTQVRPRDALRRGQMLALLNAGHVQVAADYACAGLIFQHGESADEARLAYSMFVLAGTLDPTIENVRYLQAAAWDRLMGRLHRPQWYGTQFERVPGGGWRLAEIDESAVTDADRVRLDVDPLAESRRHVEQLNSRAPAVPSSAAAR